MLCSLLPSAHSCRKTSIVTRSELTSAAEGRHEAARASYRLQRGGVAISKHEETHSTRAPLLSHDEKTAAFQENLHLYGDSEYATEGWKNCWIASESLCSPRPAWGRARSSGAGGESGRVRKNRFLRADRAIGGRELPAVEQGAAEGLAAWKSGDGIAYSSSILSMKRGSRISDSGML